MKRTKPRRPPGVHVVAQNRKARFNFEVVDAFEVGVVLTGTEVKSLRDGKIQLMDAYATVEAGEVWLNHAHIAEYANGTHANHEPTRRRKLLLHRPQIDRLESKVKERGFTLIPLEVYFKEGRAKLMLGLCRGKAVHDKRHAIRERDDKRAAARSLDEV